MARTRNSDPGRVEALHYAAATWQRHAKRLVYAFFTVLGLHACGWGLPHPAFAQDRDTATAPCASCQAFSLLPGAVAALPDQLAGVRVLIRIAPGTPRAEWAPALETVTGRGGIAGLHVSGVPAPGDPALDAGIAVLLMDAPDDDPDRAAFELKRALSTARGRNAQTRLLIAAAPATLASLRERGLGSYLDAFLPVTPAIAVADDLLVPLAAGELRVWRLPDSVAASRDLLRLAAALQDWLPGGLVPVAGRALRCGADRSLPALLNPQTLDLVALSRECPPSAAVTSDIPGARAERLEIGGFSLFRVRVDGGDRFAAGVEVAAARPLTIEEIIARHQAAAARQRAQVRTTIAEGSLTLTFEAPGFVAPITVTSQTTIFEDRRPPPAGPGTPGPTTPRPRDQGPGTPGLTTPGPATQGPGTPGPATQGPGTPGSATQGPGTPGSATQGPGTPGSATQGPGTAGPATQGPTDQGPTDQGRIDLRQRDIRVNGVLFTARGGVPRLPIIEPERAAAPPLAITLSDVYRYRLAGRERSNGRDCHVVAFEPRDRGAPLHEGRAWIDAVTFGMVRVSAAQTGLRGPITASEQIDDFTGDGAGGWRLARSSVRQTYEGASVRTPIHRLVIIDRLEINPVDFDSRRAAAYASTDVMLRDTPQGFRYLKAEGKRQQAKDGTAAAPAAERVVAGRADQIRTLAFGVIVDPNITRPLPFAGLSYVDFNLFGTGTQFSGFFGGSYGQLAFSAPSIRGSRWQLAGRAFGIATSYNDRAFEGGREQYTLDIRQRPAQAAVWVLRPLTPRSALRLEYDWDYTKFDRADVTDAAFAVPRNQSAHALRVGLDVQRAGWQGSLWGSHAGRLGWRRWGLPGAAGYDPRHGAYQRFGASVLRSQALSPRVTTRVEAAVMGGRNLDRFSRFAFGTFDNRLHGYPSALVRYDRGAVLRTAVAWTAARILRLDLFADTAQVRDPGFGPGFRNFTGLGAAVEAPAPFGTLLAAEWGFGLQGVNTSGRRGTHVVRISGYKVF